MRRTRPIVVTIVAISVALAACGSSSNKSSPPAATTTTGPAAYPVSTALGPGVTANSIKLGIGLIDYKTLGGASPTTRVNQDKNYLVYINDINQHGGINGRMIVPVFSYFLPIGPTGPLKTCTQFTEDDKVFAVTGDLYDTSGDAQTCVARQNKTPLITFELNYSIMAKAPAGLEVYAGTAPERTAAVLLQLMGKQGVLDGKTVGVLAASDNVTIVKKYIEPGLKKITTAKTVQSSYLTIGSSQDTTQQQAQLDSYIEKWKTQGVNALFLSGTAVSSQQFTEKIRKAMPDVILMSDTTDVLGEAQQEHQHGANPNPYEGIYSAAGFTAKEYDNGPNWAYCKKIYEEQMHTTPPNAETQSPTNADGQKVDTYGGINDACQLVTVFHDIMVKVGKYANAANFAYTVNHFGPITNRGGGTYASLTAGKTDIDDSFRLQQYDSSIPPDGQWKPLTDVQNVTGVG